MGSSEAEVKEIVVSVSDRVCYGNAANRFCHREFFDFATIICGLEARPRYLTSKLGTGIY